MVVDAPGRPHREHVLLLCNGRDECDACAMEMLNSALQDGQFCIYASVLNGRQAHLDTVAANIRDYRRHLENGDLVVLDFQPFYESALAYDLAPFVGLKASIESALGKRKAQGADARTLIFAEAAGMLCAHGYLDASSRLESWWNDVHAGWVRDGLDITVVCPHFIGNGTAAAAGAGNSIMASLHTLVVELMKENRKKPRVLIVEPEPDIRFSYRRYLASAGVDAVIVGSLEECLSKLSEAASLFDVIIIDSHFRDGSAIELARRVKEASPWQRIVITTTLPMQHIAPSAQDAGIPPKDVLIKPFSLSSLLSALGAPGKDGPGASSQLRHSDHL